jgi:hypothetical protein
MHVTPMQVMQAALTVLGLGLHMPCAHRTPAHALWLFEACSQTGTAAAGWMPKDLTGSGFDNDAVLYSVVFLYQKQHRHAVV